MFSLILCSTTRFSPTFSNTLKLRQKKMNSDFFGLFGIPSETENSLRKTFISSTCKTSVWTALHLKESCNHALILLLSPLQLHCGNSAQ